MKIPPAFLWLLLLPALLPAQPGVFAPVSGFDCQGHRGCRGLLPENSLPAFRRAMELGVTTLELDLAVSRDSLLVISHDPWMSADLCRDSLGKPASGKEDPLFQMPYARIRTFDCGSAGNSGFPEQKPLPVIKPLLTELLDSVALWISRDGLKPVAFNLEIKSRPEWDGIYSPDIESFARLLVKVMDQYHLQEKGMIQSFDPRTLEAVHRLNPKLCLVLLSEHPGSLRKQLAVLSFTPACFSPHYRLVSARMIREAHAQGIRLVPWTVNKEKDMQRLIRLGVDGLITDYPDRLLRVRQK